jgi:hypothetical protein
MKTIPRGARLRLLVLKKSKNEPVKVVIFADSPFRDEKKKKKFNRRLDEQDNRENILGNVLVA